MLQLRSNLHLDCQAIVDCVTTPGRPIFEDQVNASVTRPSRVHDIIGHSLQFVATGLALADRNESPHATKRPQHGSTASNILHLPQLHMWIVAQLKLNRRQPFDSLGDQSLGIDLWAPLSKIGAAGRRVVSRWSRHEDCFAARAFSSSSDDRQVMGTPAQDHDKDMEGIAVA